MCGSDSFFKFNGFRLIFLECFIAKNIKYRNNKKNTDISKERILSFIILRLTVLKHETKSFLFSDLTQTLQFVIPIIRVIVIYKCYTKVVQFSYNYFSALTDTLNSIMFVNFL